MVLAAYAAAAFLVAGIHAFFLLRDPQSVFHRASCSIAPVVACVSIPLQMVSGDFAAEEVAKLQPTKLAARSFLPLSKLAVIGLTKSAVLEFAAKRVRINAVCPAIIETGGIIPPLHE